MGVLSLSVPASSFPEDTVVESLDIVLCKGRKLNGAVSWPATPRGDTLSICSLPSKCWQFGPLSDSKLVSLAGNESSTMHQVCKGFKLLNQPNLASIDLRGWTSPDVKDIESEKGQN